MAFPETLREHVASLLSWSDAHVDFDDAVAGLPATARGKVPEGLPYSPWQLVEHIRLAQADILEFCGPDYRKKRWPEDYWPESSEPPDARAWDASVAQIRRDRGALEHLARDPQRELAAPLAGGQGQTLLRELLLTADHTAYHVGQLVAVRRLLGHWAREQSESTARPGEISDARLIQSPTDPSPGAAQIMWGSFGRAGDRAVRPAGGMDVQAPDPGDPGFAMDYCRGVLAGRVGESAGGAARE